jgi:hypothetical protein
LDFTYFEKSSRDELLTRLAGLPPPVPQRRVRTAAQRVSDTVAPVLVHKVITLWDEPVFPLTRITRLPHPKGVFAAA